MGLKHLQIAARVVNSGGAIGYPTETLYGIGCHPHDEDAVAHIAALKHRSLEQGFILVASRPEQIDALCNDTHWRSLLRPLGDNRATTWLMPATPAVPRWLTGRHQSIAIRLTTNPLTRRLCDMADTALISTSANPHGKKPAGNALRARFYFGTGIDYYVPGETFETRASRIIDGRSGKLLRR